MDQQIEIQIKCLSPKKTWVLLRCFWKKWRIANNSIIRTVVWRKRLAIAEVTSDTRTRFELHQSIYHYNFQNTNFSDNIFKKKKSYGFSIWTIWVESEKWPFIKTQSRIWPEKIHLNQEQVDKTKLPPHHQILINHTQPPFHFSLIRNHN